MKKRQHAWRTAFRALDENFTGALPDKQFLDVLMKVNFSLPKTQLMQIAASCTEGNAGGGRSFAPGSTHVNYNQFLRQVEAVLKENLREGSDILRAGGQGEHGQDGVTEDKHPDADRRATIGKLIRALSIIDENDEGLLSLQQLLQVAMEYREALNVEARQVVDIIDTLAARGVGAKTSWREMVRLLDAAGRGQHSTRTAAVEQKLHDMQLQHSRGGTPLMRPPTSAAPRADVFSIQSSPHGKEFVEGGRVRLTPHVDPLSMRTKMIAHEQQHQQSHQQHQPEQQQRPTTRGSGHVNPFEERRQQLERASVSRQSLGSRGGSRGL